MKVNFNIPYYLLIVCLFLISNKGIAQDTFRDTFGSSNYGRNDGNQAWFANWNEIGEANDPAAGRIFINTGQQPFNFFQLLFINLDAVYIERRLDLSSYGYSVLTFDYDELVFDEILDVQLRDNVGNYQTILSIDNTFNEGSFKYLLANNERSADSRIRFRDVSGDQNWATNEGIFIDNVTFTAGSSAVYITDITVNENAGTFTFTALFTGNATAPFSVNYATVDGTAYADSDFIADAGTFNFTGTPGQQITRTITLVDNNFVEDDETFTIALSGSTNGAIDLFNSTVTIIDDADATAVPNEPTLNLFDEFDGNFDYATTGGSLRTEPNSGNQCAITTSDSADLTSAIPAGSTIEKAFLYWAHSGTSADDVVTFEGQQVAADIVQTAFNGLIYGMISDVTALVSGLPDPSGNTYDFSGLTIDNTNNSVAYCNAELVVGGWTLFIFYTNPSLPSSTINLYSGFSNLQNTNPPQSFLLDNFFANGSAGSKTTVLSWEGDVPLANAELLTVTPNSTGTPFTLSGDGNNNGTTTNNPFNSTVFDGTTGVNRTTEYGLDLDTYDISAIIPVGETQITTDVDVGQDRVFLNAVILKVPSNLIKGTVFEDVNYPGGPGRNRAASSGIPIENATVELYREAPAGTFTFVESTSTDSNGEYIFGGMINDDYAVRVVNSTVRSIRNGASCTSCYGVQTFRTFRSPTSNVEVDDEVGGTNPAAQDAAAGTATGAQSISPVNIDNEGVTNLDFGFNFNTIVNTNATGQGSLEQFITNSNNLNETGLDIEAHPNDGSINPAAGEDTSIFMIPPTGDPLGRTPDAGYIVADGYFDIFINSGSLPVISDNNTVVDGRTQTAYSTDTNTGTIGAGGTAVGTNNTLLPNYNLPEIQVRKNTGSGFGFEIDANNVVVRNTAISGDNASFDGIRITSGSNILITENLIGTDALGNQLGVDRHGIRVNGGESVIDGNYIAGLGRNGVRFNGGTISSILRNNHFNGNGVANCDSNVEAQGGGSGIVIENNLIENGGNYGVDNINSVAMIIDQNTIRDTGALSTGCANQIGIRTQQPNTTITGNVINNNGRVGIFISSGTGNLISQNSIFANGFTEASLGIDIGNDGVTINDNGDGDGGPNNRLNFPIFDSAVVSGNNLIVTGWVGAGATVELFLSDIDTGDAAAGDNAIDGPSGVITQDYGEGKVFLGSAIEGSPDDNDGNITAYTADVDGNEDTTNRFSFVIPLGSAIPVNSIITATATVSNSTSEFGTTYVVKRAAVITNRRITYRVKAN
ncbi:Calx-beta domain-containing protein [Aquimarina celericrescens]|uniref:Calx-beta domain-containing protein n=1 Tax=Aquimarina celericrescens TaxID=1964542 RepID=A0ABW5AZG2_9FLAO|nr:right-handed parallel beta-helix repeat-containing protein [Aquimarina celericrescens]